MERFANIANIWKPFTIFIKSSILNVWLSSEYASAYHNLPFYFGFLHYTVYESSFVALHISNIESKSGSSENPQKCNVRQLFRVITSRY